MKPYATITIFTIALVAPYLTPAAQDAAPDKVLNAGAATSNITPWLGLSIAGHMRDRKANYVHDELHVRSLVIDNGDSILGFTIVDSCMVPRHVFDAAKSEIQERAGIPATNILMAATHTHSAACATPVFQSDPHPDYQAFLTSRIVDAVLIALENRRPAQIAYGKGALEKHVFNRRWHLKEGNDPKNPFGGTDKVKMNPPRGSDILQEPAGPTDPEVPVIALRTTDGRPIALLANYALHYVGGTAGGGHVSADYFGMFAKTVGQSLAPNNPYPPFVAIITNGASGDINNINFREERPSRKPYEQMSRVADDVAHEVLRVYETLDWKDWVPLAAAQEEITLAVRKPDQSGLDRAKSILENADGPLTQLEEIYARETVLLNNYPDNVDLILQAFKVGDLAITAIPCEVFVEIGRAIKDASPFNQTILIELANGYNGYLPTPKHHQLGGYETWRARSSYLETKASDRISSTILNLLDDLH